ncbi:secreted protein, partial [Candidatus Magnetomorum sp. HK-1]
MIKNLLKIFVLFLCLLFLPFQSLYAKKNEFKFPKQIVYKIIQNKRYLASTNFLFQKKGIENYQLTMGSIKGFGLSSNDKCVTYISQKDYSLRTSLVLQKKELKEELRFKEERNLGLLGDHVFIHKSFEKDSSQTITEIASPHTVLDLSSSFVVLSKKISNKNFSDEKFNLFIAKTSYIVNCTVKKDVPFNYKNKKLSTSLVTLKYMFKKDQSKNKNQPESVDLIIFYIYNDEKKGFIFPIC